MDGMINEYEEENDSWSLLLINDVYSDAKKLFAMKQILKWQMSKMADFKYDKALLLESGAKTKLLEIQRKLVGENIRTNVVLRDLL